MILNKCAAGFSVAGSVSKTLLSEVQPKQIQGKAPFSAATVPRVSKSRVLSAPDWMDPQCMVNWCDLQSGGFLLVCTNAIVK